MAGTRIGGAMLKKFGYALAVVLVALAVLSFVSDAPMVDTAFDAVLPLIFVFFAYQAVSVRGSVADPLALFVGAALVVGALTEWYVLLAGAEGTAATVGRLVSVAGLVAYVWLLVRTSERGQSDAADLGEEP